MKKTILLLAALVAAIAPHAQSLLPTPEWTNESAILKGQIIGYEKGNGNDRQGARAEGLRHGSAKRDVEGERRRNVPTPKPADNSSEKSY